LGIGHAYQDDIGFLRSNRKRANFLAIEREPIVERSFRSIAYGRDGLTEEAVQQHLQLTCEPLRVATLSGSDLHVPRGRHEVFPIHGADECHDRAARRGSAEWVLGLCRFTRRRVWRDPRDLCQRRMRQHTQ
jgi:hypothetical protein